MGDSPTQKIADLKSVVEGLAVGLRETTRRVERLEGKVDQLEGKLDTSVREAAALRERLATTEAQSIALKHLSDRGWGLTQALIVLAISIAASTITQLVFRK